MTSDFSLAAPLQYGKTSCNDQNLRKAFHVGNAGVAGSKKLYCGRTGSKLESYITNSYNRTFLLFSIDGLGLFSNPSH